LFNEPEPHPGRFFNKLLAFAERVADGRSILGYPVTSELGKVVHPMDVNLRADEDMIGEAVFDSAARAGFDVT
jgi:hypothetical protein